jgi:deferrochelatase/peroxidase EfeB
VREYLAAQLIGRWKDGTSLVRHPVRAGSQDDSPAEPDNDFLVGEEDPTGVNCPFGAHVRRANPRDHRFPGSKEEIATVNRHRILRVGRSYDFKDEKGEQHRGLLFMCLNADIERQFEFVQKTWLLNPNMHGLEGEIDPLLGSGPRKLTVPTQTGPVELEIKRDFVRVIGGGYFFLPGRLVLRYLASNFGGSANQVQTATTTTSEQRGLGVGAATIH